MKRRTGAVCTDTNHGVQFLRACLGHRKDEHKSDLKTLGVLGCMICWRKLTWKPYATLMPPTMSGSAKSRQRRVETRGAMTRRKSKKLAAVPRKTRARRARGWSTAETMTTVLPKSPVILRLDFHSALPGKNTRNSTPTSSGTYDDRQSNCYSARAPQLVAHPALTAPRSLRRLRRPSTRCRSASIPLKLRRPSS